MAEAVGGPQQLGDIFSVKLERAKDTASGEAPFHNIEGRPCRNL